MNLLIALLISLTPVKTVQAGGKVITVTSAQMIYLKSLHNPAIDQALQIPGTLKNNQTADLIINLLTK